MGFMGSGKTTVGRTLADRLGWPFRDLDEMIEEQTQQSIPEIFRNRGEKVFRELETRALEDQSERKPPFILATGGGLPERSRNRKILSRTGDSFYLDVDFDIIYERIRDDEGRPLVPKGKNSYSKLRRLWEQRQPCYKATGKRIPLSDEDPEAVAEKILSNLSELGAK